MLSTAVILTGQDVILGNVLSLGAEAGIYVLTGQDILFSIVRRGLLQPGRCSTIYRFGRLAPNLLSSAGGKGSRVQ